MRLIQLTHSHNKRPVLLIVENVSFFEGHHSGHTAVHFGGAEHEHITVDESLEAISAKIASAGAGI